MIDKIKQLLKQDLEIAGRATPGPWQAGYDDGSGDTTIHAPTISTILAETNPGCGCCQGDPTDADIANTKLIAHSRTVFESRVKALEIAIGALRTGVGFEPLYGLEPNKFSEALASVSQALGIDEQGEGEG